MSFGLPCPDELDPAAVYSGTQQVSDIVTGLVTAIETDVQSAYQQAVAYTGQSVGILQKTLQSQIAAVQRLFATAIDALAGAITTGNVGANVQFSSALQSISQALQIPTEEVLYGPAFSTAPPPPFVPGAPVAGGIETLPPQGGPVEVGTSAPATTGIPSGVPTGQPVIIWRDGAPTTLTAVCAPVQSANPVLVNGRAYQPTASVYDNNGRVDIGPDGRPFLSIGYDSQPDGSVVVYAGPVSVQLSLPPHSSDPDAPACAIG